MSVPPRVTTPEETRSSESKRDALRRRRIIVLNRYFYPSQAPTGILLSDLAFALSERGTSVVVITSRLSYEESNTRLPRRETIRGVETYRVWTTNRGHSGFLGRGLDYASFFLAAAWRLGRIARTDDIVVAKSDPPLLSLMAAPMVWLTGARLVNWLQDIFPEVAEALRVGGRLGKVSLRVIRPLRNWSLDFARLNVVVGAGMAEHLRREGITRDKIRVIPNWFGGVPIEPIPTSANELRKNWALNGRFVVAYAGNLGRPHDVATIIESATLVQELALRSPPSAIAQRIMFVFVGSGVQRARLEAEVLQRRLTNVRMYPYQPRERLAETLCVADLHLISLNSKLEGLCVPSKFYGIAAAGRPSVFIGAADGEIARLLDKSRCGFTVALGDAKGLMNQILRLAENPKMCAEMGARARLAFEQHWDKPQAIDQWREALKAAAGRHCGNSGYG
jgi:colanic acid biosynthesis glycosyl transferase WcaI